MRQLIEEELSLELLRQICSGIGVEINVSKLSRDLNRHRNTIKDRIEKIFQYKLIDRPLYPLQWLFNEYPLLVISRYEFPRNEKINTWIEEDPHIFAAFYVKEDEYNTLMIEFHKDIGSYVNWKENIPIDEKNQEIESRYPSKAWFFGAECIVKYDPGCSIKVFKDNLKEGQHKDINGYEIDELSFEIIERLMNGQGIKTNENLLARELSDKFGPDTSIHRKTVQRRVDILLKEKIVTTPACHFPRLFVPPDYIFVISLLEIRKQKDRILNVLKTDNHVPFIVKASVNKFNILMFSSFYRIEDALQWKESLDLRFPHCIGALRSTYLSPQMTFSINQEFVSLELIKSMIRRIHGRNLMHMLKSDIDEPM